MGLRFPVATTFRELESSCVLLDEPLTFALFSRLVVTAVPSKKAKEPPRSSRVLVVIDTAAACTRGILRGFTAEAHQHDWALLHYHRNVDMGWLSAEWAPDVAVVGPDMPDADLARLAPAKIISVNC